MFCPVCKAEYRLGFTECSDCSVPLVESLPEGASPIGSQDEAADLASPEKLWSGVDPRTFAAIRDSLDAANVPYNDEEPQEARLLRTLPQKPFEIWIQKADHDAARKVLAELLGDEEKDPLVANGAPEGDFSWLNPFGHRQSVLNVAMEQGTAPEPDEPDGPEQPSEETPAELPDDFYAEDATSDVWSGSERGMAKILSDCLRENAIPSVVSHSGENDHVFVLPAAEKRAREIIREVIEATPPG